VRGGRNRGNHILKGQVSLPLLNDGFRMRWRLAAGMTRRHHRLSAMTGHVMTALALGISGHEPGQETRHSRCRSPQQDSTQHNGVSYAVHFHESISFFIARQQNYGTDWSNSAL
jgi:hypothetical protein